MLKKNRSNQILTDNFVLQGTGRVGDAQGISLARKVQLAVLAHIRHKYTHYDFLLHTIGYIDARRTVEEPCLQQILKWRGEDSSMDSQVEEIFREVIVLDDEDLEESTTNRASSNRESSVEVISVRRLNASSTDLEFSASNVSARATQIDAHESVNWVNPHYQHHGSLRGHNLELAMTSVAPFQQNRRRHRGEESQSLQLPNSRNFASANPQQAIASRPVYGSGLRMQAKVQSDQRPRKRQKSTKIRPIVGILSHHHPSASLPITLAAHEVVPRPSETMPLPDIVDLTRSSSLSIHSTSPPRADLAPHSWNRHGLTRTEKHK